MNLRWLWLDHFPPELELSDAERAKAKQMAVAHQKRNPDFHGARKLGRPIFIITCIAALGVMLGPLIAHKRIGSPMIMYFVIFYPGTFWALYRARRPFIRKALNDMGHPVCINCGYLLTGVVSNRCPECGEVRVQTHPRPLTTEERANPEIIQMMQRLGYSLCLDCGEMWMDQQASQCPGCKSQRICQLPAKQ